MSLSKISNEELRKARKAGFKRKKPKMPKKSASYASLEGYVGRYNEWVKLAKEKSSEVSKKETLKKQIFGH